MFHQSRHSVVLRGLTHGESDILLDRENDRGNGSGKDDRPPTPEAVHLKQHSPEVGTGQVSCPECISVYLAASSIDCHHVLDQRIQRGRHHGSFGCRGNAEGGLEAAHAKNVEGEMNDAEVEHDGRKDHRDQANCWF